MSQKLIHSFILSNKSQTNSLSKLQSHLKLCKQDTLPPEIEMSIDELEALLKESLISLSILANYAQISLSDLLDEILDAQGV
jgi:hypothetical protein